MEIIMILFILLYYLTYHSMNSIHSFLNFSSMEEVECGLDSMSESNMNSNQFFVYLVIFLLFDLELVTMIPMMMSNSSIFYVMVSLLVVMTMIYELIDYSLKFN